MPSFMSLFSINKSGFFSENGAVLFFLVEYCTRFPSSTSNLNNSSKLSQYSFKLIKVTSVQRFMCSPRKFQFFKQPMNLVDFCAIIPFFLDLVIGGLQVTNPFWSPDFSRHSKFDTFLFCRMLIVLSLLCLWSLRHPNCKQLEFQSHDKSGC